MKFGQFMSHFKRTIFIKVFSKICVLETSSRLFCVYEKVSTIYWKMKFLKQIVCIKYFFIKSIELYQSQHGHFHRFLFEGDTVKRYLD